MTLQESFILYRPIYRGYRLDYCKPDLASSHVGSLTVLRLLCVCWIIFLYYICMHVVVL